MAKEAGHKDSLFDMFIVPYSVVQYNHDYVSQSIGHELEFLRKNSRYIGVGDHVIIKTITCVPDGFDCLVFYAAFNNF